MSKENKKSILEFVTSYMEAIILVLPATIIPVTVIVIMGVLIVSLLMKWLS